MKQIYTLLISFFFVATAFAQTNTAVKSGNWDNVQTWSKKHAPKDGEVVDIPSDITVTVDNNQKLDNEDMDLRIFGKLILDNGKLGIGANSKITIFATGSLVSKKGNNADKIAIGGDEKYNGSMGTIFGTRVATNSSNGFEMVTFSVLPVKFTQFSVAAQNGQVRVQWSTAQEQNAAYFEVERSTNGSNWKSIARIPAAANSTKPTHYNHIDNNTAAGTVYYRIKQADMNGQTAYTTVQSIRTQAAAAVNIVAAQNKLAVDFAQPVKGKVNILVVNHAGQVVATHTVESPAGQVVLPTASLKGVYFISIQNGAGISASKQVLL